ncbi:hypothetical protein BDV96DRAFT_579224 [Lophiotrema nucula]|uniref:Uncharacterized protein n=1 Tax=Lophiotrema nucula TaxID=690887 RepID=A0A6A5Z355_9PLEO|nr:hypothetical protein BDV96DRAFT_579224 [Lophiotrema nucula]
MAATDVHPTNAQTAPTTPTQSTEPNPSTQPTEPNPTSNAAATPPTEPTSTETTPPSPTLLQSLNAAEHHAVWKLSLRFLLVITGIIGTGCIAWAFSTASRSGPYEYALDDSWSIVWALITFGASVIWCAICILVLFLRRPRAPVHPGVAVGIDLVLWLAFIPTVMFCIIGVVSVMEWGSGGQIGEYSSYGYYYQVDNGTWVWNATEYNTYYGRSRDCSTDGYGDYGFSSCADEDRYINNLWKEKGKRVGVEWTGTVCQIIALLTHLALFIWACVDTARRNRRKVSKDAEKIAGDIVMNMVRSGALVRAPVHGGGGGYAQIPEQGPGFAPGYGGQSQWVQQPNVGGVPQQHKEWYSPQQQMQPQPQFQPQWQQQPGPSNSPSMAGPASPLPMRGPPGGVVVPPEKGDTTRFA